MPSLPEAHGAEWWRTGILYQIYPRSFADSNNDGVGDLRGITAHLDHVASLGVDGIWLSPVFRSPMADFGYDISDYRDIDPLFGTLQDFDTLVDRCHTLGLRLLIDQVLSHSSDAHPWFTQSRNDRTNEKSGWYVWADAKDDGAPPNNWLSIFGGSAWQWEPRRRQYYLHNFLASQPDLNFHNPQVQQAALDNIRFWLARGVDGVRLDVCNFYFHNHDLTDNPVQQRYAGVGHPARPINPHDWQSHIHCRSQPENLAFLSRLRALTDTFPARTMIGEIGDDAGSDRIIEYTSGLDRLHMAYSFDLLQPNHDAPYLHALLTSFEQAGNQGWPCWPISNHDVQRVATRWGNDQHHPTPALMAATLQLCLRGTPCLYMGDELGLPEADVPYDRIQDPYGRTLWPGYKGRDGCRTPMPWQQAGEAAGFSTTTPWLPVDPRHRPLAVECQQSSPTSVLTAYRTLIAWRRTQPDLLSAPMELLSEHPAILGFTRASLLCLFNPGPDAAHLPLPPPWHAAHPITPPGPTPGSLATGTASLPGWGVLILSQGTQA